MRIAMLVNPETPVPPLHYGGIERIADMLVRGLADRGHEVTLFAHPDSTSPARLGPLPGGHSARPADALANLALVTRHALRGRFDVVHSFARVLNLAPILALPIPKIASFQL